MFLTKTTVRSLPFPYFCIDKNYFIQYRSDIAMTLLMEENNFLNLTMTDFQQKIIDFLNDKTSQTSIRIPLIHVDQTKTFYYMYKLTEKEEEHIHLFCFHPDHELDEINKIVEKFETRLEQLNNKIDMLNNNDITSSIEKDETNNIHRVSSLAAGIAHEIRNPLTTIKGFIQLLRPYLVDIGKDYYADVALDEINRANEIIFEFLNASKPQVAGKQGITLSKLLHDLFILYESEAIIHNILITLSPVKENIYLTIDTQQIKQVLANILKNAIEAIIEHTDRQENGHIEISTQLTNERVCIIIADNGTGMSELTLQQLFQPFYTTKKKGTGIGLSICKEIIEANDGKIEAESTQGKGTTFKICLPIRSTDDE